MKEAIIMQKFQENFKRLLANTPENITKLFYRHHDEPSEYDDYIQKTAHTVISAPDDDIVIETNPDDPYITVSGTTPNELANNLMITAWQLLADYTFDQEEPSIDQIIEPLITEPDVLFYSTDVGCYYYSETLPKFLKIVKKEVDQLDQHKTY